MIELINVSKAFGPHKVLDRLNLTIRDGETMVIIGRSGGGKSVLLKHIIGLVRPDEGQVIVDGQEISKMEDKPLLKFRLKMGMLFQGAALFDSMTVGENVAFALSEHTVMSDDQIRSRVKECLALVGLKEIEHLKPAELSGGMKKRVSLARALAIQPTIILYDEPTTGVDPLMADTINRLIIQLHDKLKVTGVVVTHDMASAYKIADRIAMLHEGRILEVGTPAEIRATKNPTVRQFILGILEEPDLKR
jgi:phospholipid/cholesterol/gamma-HCH transport system ATP-binding protein